MTSRALTVTAAVAAAALTSGTPALAATPVTPAGGAARRALVHAFVRQDGSNMGITGAFVARSRPVLGVVCQRTPNAGVVRFVFRRSSARSWRFVLSTRTTKRGSGVERALERACR